MARLPVLGLPRWEVQVGSGCIPWARKSQLLVLGG